MLRLKKLVIHRFRDAVPGTSLEFADGLNAILGLNGTGKTTLLDLLAAVVRTDLSAYRDEELDLEVWLTREAEKDYAGCNIQYRFTATRRTGPDGPERSAVDARLSLHFSALDGAERFDIEVDETGVATATGGRTSRIESLYRIFTLTLLGSLQTRGATLGPTERQNLLLPETVGRLDEALEAFKGVTVGESPLNGVPALRMTVRGHLRGPDKGIQMTEMSYPGAIPRPFVVAIPVDWTNDGAAITADALAVGLPSLPVAIGAEEVEIRLSPDSDETRGDTRMVTYKGCDLWARWSATSQSKHTNWSFGQKRMAAFCYYAACAPQGVIFADELTNGLHHRMVEIAVEITGERQAILATQNPLLIDHMAFESAEHMRRSFVLCELQKGPRGERQWIWRNPTEDEAERFFRAYQVDVSHVSEILRSKGLW